MKESENSPVDPSHNDFKHVRDSACRYWENVDKRCRVSISNYNSVGKGVSGNRVKNENHNQKPILECNIMRKLFRQCPKQQPEMVESIEENTVEPVEEGSVPQVELFGKRKGYTNDLEREFGGFGGMSMDPFDFFHRNMEGLFSFNESNPGSQIWRDLAPRGNFRFEFNQPPPPHHKHRYEKSDVDDDTTSTQVNEDRWGRYKSEDL